MLLPLHLSLSTPPSARLRPLLVLLLLALGLLAGVSVSQTRALEAQALQTTQVALPSLQRVHELLGRIDELHGMAALHLTLASDAERAALEERLQAARLQLQRRLAHAGQTLVDDSGRQHHAQVLARLEDFRAAQDRLLAASRRAAQEPAAALQARALLAGEAQQAFSRLRATLEAWWTHSERQAGQAAAQAVAAAQRLQLLLVGQAVLAGLGLVMAWGWRRRPALLSTELPAGLPAAPLATAPAAAAQQHLQALNAAVAAARRGEPGRAAGLSALEAQRLADQVATAAQGLRRLIDRADRPG